MLTRFALVVFLGWSFLGLIAWALVGLGGDLLRAVSPVMFFGHPDGPAVAEAASGFLTAAGSGVVAVVWTLGSVALLAATLFLRAVGNAQVRMTRFEFPGGEDATQRPMKDVTPHPDRGARRLPPPHDAA